jgi:mono/diheme cytochrome c family protein
MMKAMLGAALLATATLVAGTAPETQAAAGLEMRPDTAGKAVFLGKGNCHVCHGPNAKGTVLAPDLTDGEWINIDGSAAAIAKLVKEGVAEPKKYPSAMPAMGGASLTDAEVQAVAAYVHSLRAADAK